MSSSSSSRDGPVGAADVLSAVTRSTGGGWYSPDSIERRLGRKRGPLPVDAHGKPIKRTTPGPSDEEMWLQAGAPGYADVDRSNDGT